MLISSSLHHVEDENKEWLPPLFLLRFATMDGRALQLCDFASAVYRSWLPVRDTTLSDEVRSRIAV